MVKPVSMIAMALVYLLALVAVYPWVLPSALECPSMWVSVLLDSSTSQRLHLPHLPPLYRSNGRLDNHQPGR